MSITDRCHFSTIHLCKTRSNCIAPTQQLMENITCVHVCLFLGPFDTVVSNICKLHIKLFETISILQLMPPSLSQNLCSLLPKIAQKHIAIYVPFSKYQSLKLEARFVEKSYALNVFESTFCLNLHVVLFLHELVHLVMLSRSQVAIHELLLGRLPFGIFALYS